MVLLANNLSRTLWDFSLQYVQAYQQQFNDMPLTEFDEQWPSPCFLDRHNEQLITWQPVKIDEKISFENIEQALEIKLHPDISCYFTSIFSENIAATCQEGELNLLFAWSKDDFARLQENIIGHLLMKQKLKQKLTVFFATTDDDNFILSIDNNNGEVWVERVGCEPHKKIANSVEEFITSLSPFIYVDSND